jgi:phage portal protein BeeE
MSILGAALKRSTTFRDPADWLLDALGGQSTASGIRVTNDSALSIPSVFSAVSLIADSVGQLPLKVQRRNIRPTRCCTACPTRR